MNLKNDCDIIFRMFEKRCDKMIKSIQISYDEMFEKKCRIAAETGFSVISANFNESKNISDEAWEKAPDHINGILDKYGLKCIQSHLPYYELTISAEELDDHMEKAMRNSIKTSGAIGVQWCVYHPRTAINDGYSSKKALEINYDVISKYLDWAVKADTKIALENLPTFAGIIPIMPFYTSNYYDLCELTDNFKTDKVGICWDTGHANLMEFNQSDAIRYVGKRLKCTHIHNNDGRRDNHYPPETGNIDWENVMKAFCDIGYDGPYTLEVHCQYQDDDELLKNFAEYNLACLKYIERKLKG